MNMIPSKKILRRLRGILGAALALVPPIAIAQGAAGHRVISLDYRFTPAPGTVPGTYAWPVDVGAHDGPFLK